MIMGKDATWGSYARNRGERQNEPVTRSDRGETSPGGNGTGTSRGDPGDIKGLGNHMPLTPILICKRGT